MENKSLKNKKLTQLDEYILKRIATLKERVKKSTNPIEILCTNDQIEELKFILKNF